MLESVSALSATIERLVVPFHCAWCEVPIDDPSPVALCTDCRIELSGPDRPACRRCGAHLPPEWPAADSRAGCRFCQHLKMPFSDVHCIGNYEGTLREAVLRMKIRGNESLAIQFGKWLGTTLSHSSANEEPLTDPPDIIVPVPVHWLRRLHRGYQVSGLLVEGIRSTMRPRPRWLTALRAARRTRKQGTLTTPQRIANVRGAFCAAHPRELCDRHVLLVDDVMTSGATAVEAARTLLSAGAASVQLAFVARGVGQRP